MMPLTTESRQDHILKDNRDVSIVEMGHDNVTISCTFGKIILWFGRQVGEAMIREVIFGISRVDSTANHEHEIICSYKTITEYESMGYVLISYSKTRGGYRAIFNLPFSKKIALDHFAKSIASRLKEKDVKIILHWNGSPDRIRLLYEELKKLDGWFIKRIEHNNKEARPFQ
jgi:hypothetical protein